MSKAPQPGACRDQKNGTAKGTLGKGPGRRGDAKRRGDAAQGPVGKGPRGAVGRESGARGTLGEGCTKAPWRWRGTWAWPRGAGRGPPQGLVGGGGGGAAPGAARGRTHRPRGALLALAAAPRRRGLRLRPGPQRRPRPSASVPAQRAHQAAAQEPARPRLATGAVVKRPGSLRRPDRARAARGPRRPLGSAHARGPRPALWPLPPGRGRPEPQCARAPRTPRAPAAPRVGPQPPVPRDLSRSPAPPADTSRVCAHARSAFVLDVALRRRAKSPWDSSVNAPSLSNPERLACARHRLPSGTTTRDESKVFSSGS